MKPEPVRLDRRNLLVSFAGHILFFLFFSLVEVLFVPVREPVVHTVRLVQIPRAPGSRKPVKAAEILQKKERVKTVQPQPVRKVEKNIEKPKKKDLEQSEKKEKEKIKPQQPKQEEKKPVKPPPRDEKKESDVEPDRKEDLLVANDSHPLGSPAHGTVSDIKADGDGELPVYFLELVRSKIGICWKNPYSGQARKLEVVVGFRINRDGSLGAVKVERRSGKQIFDQAATRAVYCAAPFPPVPASAGRGPLNIHFKFKFLGNGSGE